MQRTDGRENSEEIILRLLRDRSLLDPAKGGRFFDIDPAKRPTRGQKIDYVLFSRGQFSNPSGGPQGSRFSDHKVLLGSATRH